MKLRILALILLTMVLSCAQFALAAASEDTRMVIIHSPGPAWPPGVSFRNQPGVQAHIDYYRMALAAGLLSQGGLFLDNDGGMIIAASGVKLSEATELAR